LLIQWQYILKILIYKHFEIPSIYHFVHTILRRAPFLERGTLACHSVPFVALQFLLLFASVPTAVCAGKFALIIIVQQQGIPDTNNIHLFLSIKRCHEHKKKYFSLARALFLVG